MPLRVERYSPDTRDFHSEQNVVQRHSTLDEQGPCSDIAWSGPTLEAISKPPRLLIGKRAREIDRKRRRGSFASAGRC